MSFYYVLYTIRAQTGQPSEVDLMLDGKPLCMDTGAAVLVLEKTYRILFPERCLQPSKACLCTYFGESITVIRTGRSGSVLQGTVSEGSSAGGQG